MTIYALDPGPERSAHLAKTCSKCRVSLALSNFSVQREGRYGRASICKRCNHEHYYQPTKGVRMERHRARRATPEGKARERAWQTGYRRTHRLRRLAHEARRRAIARGIPFDLDYNTLELPTLCPVLGIPITCDSTSRADGSPSLDRIDNSLGYVAGNVIVVSWRANRIKSDATVDELRRIAWFYGKGQA